MNDKPIAQSSDADLRNSQVAWLRAAVRARELAKRTGTLLVVSDQGRVRHIAPEQARVAEHRPPYKKGA